MAIIYVLYGLPVWKNNKEKNILEYQGMRLFVSEKSMQNWAKKYRTEYNINDGNNSDIIVKIREIKEIRVSQKQHEFVQSKRGGCWEKDIFITAKDEHDKKLLETEKLLKMIS
jgi:hypothetical protein